MIVDLSLLEAVDLGLREVVWRRLVPGSHLRYNLRIRVVLVLDQAVLKLCMLLVIHLFGSISFSIKVIN